MEKQRVFRRKAIVFLLAGFLSVSSADMNKVKDCDIQCPKINIPRRCAAEDFIVLDGKMCRSCDIDICSILKWPPKVSVPYCSNSNCKNNHIPEKCILRRFKKINLFTLCRDCDIDVCKRPQKTKVISSTTNELKVKPLCPRLNCKLTGIPKECLLPSYEIINGQRCRKCDEDACRDPPALRIYSKRHVRY
ncbi:unnamed protein product [Mytilus coruscus]|uniref:Uncharacterized protein n=1 Tax=Mytilus coruscus TaxID=42192 RepID=A0A6J8E7M1_MYTCO|nr:unnamed protein product [Mytilus coruscus]